MLSATGRLRSRKEGSSDNVADVARSASRTGSPPEITHMAHGARSARSIGDPPPTARRPLLIEGPRGGGHVAESASGTGPASVASASRWISIDTLPHDPAISQLRGEPQLDILSPRLRLLPAPRHTAEAVVHERQPTAIITLTDLLRIISAN